MSFSVYPPSNSETQTIELYSVSQIEITHEDKKQRDDSYF